MHQEYIQQISELLERYKFDIPTLDLIYQILVKKSQNAS
jgi:hypothetical protein